PTVGDARRTVGRNRDRAGPKSLERRATVHPASTRHFVISSREPLVADEEANSQPERRGAAIVEQPVSELRIADTLALHVGRLVLHLAHQAYDACRHQEQSTQNSGEDIESADVRSVLA